MLKGKYANNTNKLQSELKGLNKILVVNKNLNEIKQELLRDSVGGFEMVGKLSNGDLITETHIRFRNVDDFESYINSIGERYEAEDAIFNGCINKINTPHFILVNRSKYGNGCDFRHEIIEYRGNNKKILFYQMYLIFNSRGLQTTMSRFYQKCKKKMKCYDYG